MPCLLNNLKVIGVQFAFPKATNCGTSTLHDHTVISPATPPLHYQGYQICRGCCNSLPRSTVQWLPHFITWGCCEMALLRTTFYLILFIHYYLYFPPTIWSQFLCLIYLMGKWRDCCKNNALKLMIRWLCETRAQFDPACCQFGLYDHLVLSQAEQPVRPFGAAWFWAMLGQKVSQAKRPVRPFGAAWC